MGNHVANAEIDRPADAQKPEQVPALADTVFSFAQPGEEGSIRARNSLSASVGAAARVVRVNSLVPIWDSRTAMVRQACGYNRQHLRMAAKKLPKRVAHE